MKRRDLLKYLWIPLSYFSSKNPRAIKVKRGISQFTKIRHKLCNRYKRYISFFFSQGSIFPESKLTQKQQIVCQKPNCFIPFYSVLKIFQLSIIYFNFRSLIVSSAAAAALFPQTKDHTLYMEIGHFSDAHLATRPTNCHLCTPVLYWW